MTIRILIFFILILTVGSFAACGEDVSSADNPDKSTNVASPSPSADNTANVDTTGGMENIFTKDFRQQKYKEFINGKWIAQNDPATSIEFSGNTLRRTAKGSSATLDYTIHLDCNAEACKKKDGEKIMGWCISTDEACYHVKNASQSGLTMINISNGKVLTYRKADK